MFVYQIFRMLFTSSDHRVVILHSLMVLALLGTNLLYAWIPFPVYSPWKISTYKIHLSSVFQNYISHTKTKQTYVVFCSVPSYVGIWANELISKAALNDQTITDLQPVKNKTQQGSHQISDHCKHFGCWISHVAKGIIGEWCSATYGLCTLSSAIDSSWLERSTRVSPVRISSFSNAQNTITLENIIILSF